MTFFQELKESEVAVFNGHLSTEDSHDSMKVTSAGDVIFTPQATVASSSGPSSSTNLETTLRSTLQENESAYAENNLDNEDSVG